MLVYLSSQQDKDQKDLLRYAISQGHSAIAPYLLFSQVLDVTRPEEQALAQELNKDLLSHADALWVLAGKLSDEMAAEVVEASRQGKEIRFISRALV